MFRRVLSVASFILRSVFTSKQGWLGVLLMLFDVLWRALSVWQTLDFLPDHLMPLVDFLSGIWGTLLLVGLGFIFIYRAVSARLPDFEQLAREEEAMKAYIEIQQELEEERKDNERFKKDMYAEMHDAEAVLAASLGYAYNENYGWVVGDHTVVTLAMEAARKLEPEDRR